MEWLSSQQQIIHGTALEIFGYGVVITGSSGSGKSELSLQLIDRKHKFIADDQVLIKQDKFKVLWLCQHNQPFIHLGGIGFVDIAATYGTQAIAGNPVRCNLLIELENKLLDSNDRVTELSAYTDILGQEVPFIRLYTAHNRPLELLVEILVKKQQQLENGYNAHEAFIKKTYPV